LNRAANNRLSELEHEVRSGSAGGIARISRAAGRPPYGIMVAPFFIDEVTAEGKSRGVIFVIHDPLIQPEPVPQTIGGLFRLPQGTAKLVAAITAGEDLKAYAERAGISMNTVRYHLRTAYARTGVRRQSELVRLISSALRDLDDHRNLN
jgi:hypothetical protein